MMEKLTGGNGKKYDYRRDSMDNVHVVYSEAEFEKKGFDGYIPPRYTTEDKLEDAPVPPAAPAAVAAPVVFAAETQKIPFPVTATAEPLPRRRILGVRRRTFYIILGIFLFLVLIVVIGVAVGASMVAKKHRDHSSSSAQAAETIGASSTTPTSVMNTPTMTTLTTFVTPTPTPTPVTITHCAQEWEGTAPFCDGKCGSGWTVVRQQGLADQCDQSSSTVIIDSCGGTSGHTCWTGNKVLCQKCFTTTVPQ